tara:strand:- start:155 stop:376 length:222 start_codon:yes stop_codon:yes gene_type:complete
MKKEGSELNPVKKNFLMETASGKLIDVVQCIEKAEMSGLLVEVVYTALKEMKAEPKTTTPLLALQIALEDWDC